MSLFSLFTPKWMKDPEKTHLLTDPEDLINAATVSLDRGVRITALQRFAELNPNEAATLADRIVSDDECAEVRIAAVAFVTDDDVLRKTAITDKAEDVCLRASEKVKDENFLADIAARSSFAAVRNGAVQRLTTEKAAEKVVRSVEKVLPAGKYTDTGISALKKIHSQKTLETLFQSLHNTALRCAILRMLPTSSDTIRSAALSDRDKDIRIAAIHLINDQDLLKAIATGNNNSSIICAAVSGISDDALLGKIALSTPEQRISTAAVLRIKDESLLRNIVLHTKWESVSRSALSQISNEDFLTQIALTARWLSVSQSALARISNKDFLIHTDLSHISEAFCLEIIKDKSTSMALLENLFSSQSKAVVQSAIQKFLLCPRSLTSHELLAIPIDQLTVDQYELYLSKAAQTAAHDPAILLAMRKTADRMITQSHIDNRKLISGEDYTHSSDCHNDHHDTGIYRHDDSNHLKRFEGTFHKSISLNECSPENLWPVISSFPNSKERMDLLIRARKNELWKTAILNDPDKDIRIAALEHIQDPEIFGDVVLRDKSYGVRIKALQYVNNPVILGKCACDTQSEAFALDALRRLADDEIPDGVVLSHFPSVACEAADRVPNHEALKDCVMKSKCEDVALHALRRLEDDEIPGGTVFSSFSIVRQKAAERMPAEHLAATLPSTDVSFHDASAYRKAMRQSHTPSILSLLLLDKEPTVRRAALMRTDDRETLLQALDRENDTDTALAILARLPDSIFTMRNAPHAGTSVRLALLKKVQDPAEIDRAAESDPDTAVRHAALARTDNCEILLQALDKERDTDALLSLLARLPDKVISMRNAPHAGTSVRLALLKKVQDPAEIDHAAESDPDTAVRLAAVERVVDQEVLYRIFSGEKDHNIRLAALSRMSDRKLLTKIAADPTLDENLRKAVNIRKATVHSAGPGGR